MSRSLFKILKNKWKLVFGMGLLGAFVSLLVSLLFPLQHRADSEVLVISEAGYGVDAYTALRSAERIGENIVNIVETDDFYSKVMAQVENTENIDRSRFEGLSERDRREKWAETVDASLNYGSGLLTISTYNKDSEKAKLLNTVILNVLINKSSEYIGQDVNLKVVNLPLATQFPVKPNLLINSGLGFVVGFLAVALLFIYRDRSSGWL